MWHCPCECCHGKRKESRHAHVALHSRLPSPPHPHPHAYPTPSTPMPRSFCIPGIAFLFCAFVLSFLVSISLPYLTALDIVRTHFDGVTIDGSNSLNEVRVSSRYLSHSNSTFSDASTTASSDYGERARAGSINQNHLFTGIFRAPCRYEQDGDKTCGSAHSGGYIVGVTARDSDVSVIISESWTRGLAVHPIGERYLPSLPSATISPNSLTNTAHIICCFSRRPMKFNTDIVRL